jgi:hypothetical protein
MKGKRLLIVGILLILVSTIVGGPLTYLAFQPLAKNPEDEAKYIIEGAGTILIEEGKYDIWLKTEDMDWEEINIDIMDGDGDKIPIDTSTRIVKLQNDKYVLYGTIKIPDNGQYNITSNSDHELYLTSPLNVRRTFIVCCGVVTFSITSSIIGLIIVIIGLALALRSRKK